MAPSRAPRVFVVSDLHLECWRDQPVPMLAIDPSGADLILLPGDIDVGTRAIAYARELAARAGVPVAFTPGNHEYYHHDMAELDAALPATAEGADVHVLLNDVTSFTIAGQPVRVLGTTLWTDYRANGDAKRPFAMLEALQTMNDHRLVTVERGARRFAPDDAADLHAAARAFLERALAQPWSGWTIVMTHHAPSDRAQAPQHQGNSLSPAFCSAMDDVVAASGADLWVCGHTHGDCDVMLGGTRLYACQLGYPGEKAFAPKLITLGDPSPEP
jgi:predicted phosphohydrolase